MPVLIKGVSEERWREFKAEAARRGLNVGDLFNKLVEEYLDERRKADSVWDELLEGKATLDEGEERRMRSAIDEFREGFEFDPNGV